MEYEQLAKAYMDTIRLLAWTLGITPYEAAALVAGVVVCDADCNE